MSVYFVDTETNGQDPPEVIELAYSHWDTPQHILTERYLPRGPITWGALATHHIFWRELEGCPPSSEARLPGDAEYIIGHNVDYDWKALGCPNIKRICTLALFRRAQPLVDSHQLVAAYYYYLGPNPTSREVAKNAHGASADVLMLAEIFQRMVGALDAPIEAIWQLSEEARIPEVIAFGKHKGTPIRDLPWDYKKWMLRQDDMDPYVLEAVRRTMK